MAQLLQLASPVPKMRSLKLFYCVYRDGLAEYQSSHLDKCLRYIARELGEPRLNFVTMKQAIDAGFKIKQV